MNKNLWKKSLLKYSGILPELESKRNKAINLLSNANLTLIIAVASCLLFMLLTSVFFVTKLENDEMFFTGVIILCALGLFFLPLICVGIQSVKVSDMIGYTKEEEQELKRLKQDGVFCEIIITLQNNIKIEKKINKLLQLGNKIQCIMFPFCLEIYIVSVIALAIKTQSAYIVLMVSASCGLLGVIIVWVLSYKVADRQIPYLSKKIKKFDMYTVNRLDKQQEK